MGRGASYLASDRVWAQTFASDDSGDDDDGDDGDGDMVMMMMKKKLGAYYHHQVSYRWALSAPSAPAVSRTELLLKAPAVFREMLVKVTQPDLT